MGDRTRGVYDKFVVERTDGMSAPGCKHHGCQYFVLDLTHDPHASPALLAYARSARTEGYELMAGDLFLKIREIGGAPANQLLPNEISLSMRAEERKWVQS